MSRPKTADVARGKWRGILLELGVGKEFLTGKHGPCPTCGGKDRFRFDNKGGDGTFICSQCGNGNGFKLLEMVKGWDFRTAAVEVDRVVGNVTAEKPKREMTDAYRRKILNDLWQSGERVQVGDPVERYLTGRNLPMPQNKDCIRFVHSCPVPDEPGNRWAMVAMVSGPDGKPATLHRTFLGPNGKAAIDEPRALMPGCVPDGAAVRLGMHGARLGVAEGIETALKASELFGMPVWSTINSTMLEKFIVPDGVEELHVFGDNDLKFAGQAAAYRLAARVSTRPGAPKVIVHIPDQPGTDWADQAISRAA